MEEDLRLKMVNTMHAAYYVAKREPSSPTSKISWLGQVAKSLLDTGTIMPVKGKFCRLLAHKLHDSLVSAF